MNKQILIYCVVISAIASLITPIFTVMTYIPAEGEVVYDTNQEDEENMSSMSGEEVDEYISQNVKMRRLTGFERVTYLFSRPTMMLYHKSLLLTTFSIVFISTLLASFLAVKGIKTKEITT